MEVVKAVDKASGYVTTQEERNTTAGLMSTAYGADFQFMKYPLLPPQNYNDRIISLGLIIAIVIKLGYFPLQNNRYASIREQFNHPD